MGPPRTGGDPLNGLDKIPANSEEYKQLVAWHSDGTLVDYTPKTFYELQPDYSEKYTLKAVQNAWNNAKRLAGGKVRARECRRRRHCFVRPSFRLVFRLSPWFFFLQSLPKVRTALPQVTI